MQLDRLGVVVQVEEEVWAEAEGALGGWEVTALALARLVNMFALIVVPYCLIKQEHPAIT